MLGCRWEEMGQLEIFGHMIVTSGSLDAKDDFRIGIAHHLNRRMVVTILT